MRIATFNVENLFDRPIAMNQPTKKEGQPAIDAAHDLNTLFAKAVYTANDKKKMLKLLKDFGLLSTRPKNKYLEFRKIKGKLFTCPKNGDPSIVASGCDDWVGWIDLKKEAIQDDAIANTARVIAEVNPDVMVLVEVENRQTLQDFHDKHLKPMLTGAGGNAFEYNMAIEGNDKRGINLGILSRFPISKMKSHISEKENGKPVFSRDCPVYYISLGNGRELAILANHFASKGSDYTGDRRRQQAGKVLEIYESLRANFPYLVVAGDFNDYPGNGSIDALLNTELVDAMKLPCYQGLPGTYQGANERDKIDYLLLSPKLQEKVSAVDVFRKGFYAPTKWQSFENITKDTKDRNQASDHHCLWADINL